MKYLRSVANLTLLDKIINEDIRKRLEIQSLNEHIDLERDGGLSHLCRMSQDRELEERMVR